MKIKLIKYTYKNGDITIDTDVDYAPYCGVIKIEEQEIEIDNRKWRKI
jgi:hypothetical protein